MKASLGIYVVLLAAAIMLGSGGCGSAADGSGDPSYSLSAAPSLTDSFTVFGRVMPILDDSLYAECSCEEPELICSCPCAGGGEVHVRASENTYSFFMNFDDCVSSDGHRFSGTVDGRAGESLDGEHFYERHEDLTIEYDFSVFGACTDADGMVVVRFNDAEGADTCTGVLQAGCDAAIVDCELSSDCGSCS